MKPTRTAVLTAAVLAGWVLFLAVVWVLGQYKLAQAADDLALGAMPLFGRWEWLPGTRLLAPIALGALVIVVLPIIARSWRWRWVFAATVLAGVAFSLALTYAHAHPWTGEDIDRHYASNAHLIDDAGGPAAFLATYVDIQVTGAVPIHLESHPPGLVLFFWAAARIGLVGPPFHNVLTLIAVAAAVAAALAIGRDVAGERLARRAAPFLVIAPAAFWHNNADVVFAGVALAAVALLILATNRDGAKAVWFTAAGGLLAGAAMMLSFSIALMAVPVLAVAVWRRRWGVLLGGGAAALAVVLAPLIWGYWWLDGLAATRVRYYAGVASDRGYWYFLLANLAVFSLALGPAIVVALARLRAARMWIVVGSCLAAVAIADLSGMSSSEVERIWQPFMPLVLLAGCALTRARAWLVLQLTVSIALAATLWVQW